MSDYVNLTGAVIFVFALLTSQISRRMGAYLLLPIVLAATEFVGTLLQITSSGPEVLQNHLHNLGAPSLCATIALLSRDRRANANMAKGMLPNYAHAKAVLSCVLFGWLCGVVLGCVIEVLYITAGRGAALAQGYSGYLDRYDIIAYLISGAIITFNHFKLGPPVLRKIRQDERNQRRRRN